MLSRGIYFRNLIPYRQKRTLTCLKKASLGVFLWSEMRVRSEQNICFHILTPNPTVARKRKSCGALLLKYPKQVTCAHKVYSDTITVYAGTAGFRQS